MIKGNLIITNKEILKTVKKLAANIPTGKDVVLLGVLDGCIPFLADLMKCIKGNVVVKTVKASSFDGTRRAKQVKFNFNFNREILRDKTVIIVDDILDSGHTISDLTVKVAMYTNNIRWCCLLKRETAEKHLIMDGYITLPENIFVVGYGLDFKGLYRNLNGIYALKT